MHIHEQCCLDHANAGLLGDSYGTGERSLEWHELAGRSHVGYRQWRRIPLHGRPVTAAALPGQNELMGGFWANILQTSTHAKRSAMDQLGMQMLQQYLAAVLNVHCSVPGRSPCSASRVQSTGAITLQLSRHISGRYSKSEAVHSFGTSAAGMRRGRRDNALGLKTLYNAYPDGKPG